MSYNPADGKMRNPEAAKTTLPYPEEAPDYTQTITGEQLLQKFFARYYVPQIHWDFWRTVTVIVDKNLKNPAAMSSETKTLYLKPEYGNAGILAHEFSHLSYAQLSDSQKSSFASDYVNAMQKDQLLRTLYAQKPYIKSSLVEAHAEIYRYLGTRMPEVLKKYYPKLIG
jgi:hypothetical protein